METGTPSESLKWRLHCLLGFMQIVKEMFMQRREAHEALQRPAADINNELGVAESANKKNENASHRALSSIPQHNEDTTAISAAARPHGADSDNGEENFHLWRLEDLEAQDDEQPIRQRIVAGLRARHGVPRPLAETAREQMTVQIALGMRRDARKKELELRRTGAYCVCASVAECARKRLETREWCVICE